MALTNGPLFSLSASGKLANAIVFSRWKGRPYVRELVTPSNPQSAAQVGMRSMMRFLSQAWASVASAAQESWEDLADADAIANFNAFCRFNLREWRDFFAPSMGYPAPRALAADDASSFATSIVGRDVLIEVDVANVQGDNWGLAIHRAASTGFAPNWNNVIRVIPAGSGDSVEYYDGPLAAGDYYYRISLFSSDGAKQINAAEETETIT